MNDTTILLAALSAACGAVGAMVTAWFTGRAAARKSVDDSDAGTTGRALAISDELRQDVDALRTRVVTLEGQYRQLWDEHVALQREHARVSLELTRSEGQVAELRKRVAELERAGAPSPSEQPPDRAGDA